MSRFGAGGQRARVDTVLTLSGCAFLVVSMVVPVMRWQVNEQHETAGNARVWVGDAWTLADGGFEGAWFLPAASASVIVLAAAALLDSWRTEVGAAVVAAYVPAWTALAFVRKLEDDVDVDVGVGTLMLGSLLVVAGLWLGRTRSTAQPPAGDGPTAGRPTPRHGSCSDAPHEADPLSKQGFSTDRAGVMQTRHIRIRATTANARSQTPSEPADHVVRDFRRVALSHRTV